MKRYIFLLLVLLMIPTASAAGEMEDDPLLSMLVVDQLEIRDIKGDDVLAWEVDGWLGKDLQKLWLKSEGEHVDEDFEEAELQLLYSRAVAPYWDIQLGWRHDIHPKPSRDWATLGVKGLAPYYFDIDASLFVGASGRTAARLVAEYELMLTQKLVLVPEVELNLFGKDDDETGTGSGLSDIEAGLRLRYEIRREFAPYVGVNWTHLFGDTADYAREEGEDTDDVQLVLGLRFWF